MKFSPSSILGVFSGASPELDAIINVLLLVQDDLDNLDTVIRENGAALDPMIEASRLIISTLSSGTHTISSLARLKLGSSIRLLKPVSELRRHSQALADRLMGVKRLIDDQGNTEIIRQQVCHIKEATQLLITTMLGKIPSEGQNVAKQQAQGIVDILSNLEISFSTNSGSN
ncbi:hypothetical protein C2857_004453 [Epichloe festucae Fl1]|uniref:Uncharacterized protein n=1 Tax=Epichloe festucae (strain Fl1) TaxID=877507 RepID=A0A7S9KKS4_EPIFF|nr:hypothetical protein C2857_004453 [Epichloe festucae Fl1]